jgi:hypothetical protein
MSYLYWISFTDSFVFGYPVRVKFSSASTAGHQVATHFGLIILAGWLFVLIGSSHRFDWLLRLCQLTSRTFVDIWFLDHRTGFASLLMWNQRLRVESSSTIFALDQSIFNKGIKRLCVVLIHVFFCYFLLV